MKKLVLLLLCLPVFLFGQDAKAPTLYELVTIKAKAGQEEAFEAAVKSHNAKFHGEGIYNASLHYTVNGPNGGSYDWIMGPTSYTALDSRPGEGGHDEDWKKVAALSESISSPTYWSLDTDLTQRGTGGANAKSRIWVFDLKSGQAARWAELVGKVKAVYEKKRPNEDFIVVWNNFDNTAEGRDVGIVWNFDKWAWLDQQTNFAKDYEEVHGEGSWHNFLNEFEETNKGRVDWLRERIK